MEPTKVTEPEVKLDMHKIFPDLTTKITDQFNKEIKPLLAKTAVVSGVSGMIVGICVTLMAVQVRDQINNQQVQE